MLGCVNAASKAYQTYDASHLRAAGIGNGQRLTSSTAAPHKETAASSLRWDAQRPETPTELKKYRLSALHTPGVVYKHFGAADDPVDRDRTYGRVRFPFLLTHYVPDGALSELCSALLSAPPATW